MPSFTLVISDEPFTRDDIGPAPFIETIEHGANSNCSTPATEAFKRCLDAVAVHRASAPVPSVDELGELTALAEIEHLEDALTEGMDVVDAIWKGDREDGFDLAKYRGADSARIAEARIKLGNLAGRAEETVRAALDAVRILAMWPNVPEGDDK